MGCLSCHPGSTYLNNSKCVCSSDDNLNNLYNNNGVCTCTNGYYNISNTICLPCPSNCLNCKYNPFT